MHASPSNMPHTPRVVVTRPQPEAQRWVAQLASHGVVAQALPLIDIRAITEPHAQAAISQARAAWQRYGAIMLVSGNAAQFFIDEKTALALTQQSPKAIKTRVWTPGPGTALAARAQGIASHLIDQPSSVAPQFDSEALWAQVQPQVPTMAQRGQRVLIVRGATEPGGLAPASTAPATAGDGRQWLAAQLQAAGVAVDFVAVYERHAPRWSPALVAQACAALDGRSSIWLFSSAQALAHLCQQLSPAQLATARALATHERIAAAAVQAGFGTVQQCRPAVADVVASLESPL